MKKFSVVLAAAGLTASLGAYASLPTDAAPFSLNIPNLKSGIEITLEGLLLRPHGSNLDYATTDNFTANDDDTFPLFNLSNDQDVKTVNPNYQLGFRVGLGYVFADSGNDLQLNWTHFQHTYSNSSSIGDNQFLVTGAGVPLINPNLFDFLTGDVTASSSVKFQFDSIDLDVGQYVNVGTRLQTRLFGGLRYAYVKQNTSNDYDATYADAADPNLFITYDEDDTFNSKFNGLGPRLGFQAAYNVYDCFGVTGSIAGSLLVGKVKSTSDQNFELNFVDNDIAPPVDVPVSFSVSNDSNVWRIVPEVDARLGVNYTWLFANQSALTLEAGYQVTQYFNAVDKIETQFSQTGGVLSTNRVTSDVGNEGPYLSLNYKM